MHYSIESRDRKYVKGYEFLSFARNIGKNISSKLVDNAKKSATDAVKTVLKREIQITAETTGDLIGNKTDDKITSSLKKSPKELHSKELPSNEANNEIPKERYISTRKTKKY